MAADNVLFLENMRIGFHNFSGKEGKYNRAGDRNFCVFLDPKLASEMEAEKWNVKYLKPREEGEEPQAYLQVTVGFNPNSRPPKIVMVTSRGKTTLDENMVELLDWAEITMTDMALNPYDWEVNGKTGRKAYVKSLFANIYEDELDRKYIDVPDSAANTLAIEAGGPSDIWGGDLEDLGETHSKKEIGF